MMVICNEAAYFSIMLIKIKKYLGKRLLDNQLSTSN